MADEQLLREIATEMGRTFESLTQLELDQLNLWVADVQGEIAERFPNGGYSTTAYNRVVRLAVSQRAMAPDFGVVSRSVGVDDARVDVRYERGRGVSLMRPEWWTDLGWSDSESFTIVPASSSTAPFYYPYPLP